MAGRIETILEAHANNLIENLDMGEVLLMQCLIERKSRVYAANFSIGAYLYRIRYA
ncbi:hypothetical protein AGMMS50229_10220 [Campylobacterota bacterium]|nr:hypothetical protein AGMMS50229_10220 [Campylobacterota bacterium]